jgi:LuxR family maltose regulon positive regulatory protein
MFEAELILKTTPPRLPRAALERPRFVDLWKQVGERAVMAVVAPAGFGKTTLMLQWRRLWLERGSFVAWATLDAQDEPARFARSVLNAMRSATSRAAFEPLAALCAAQPDREMEAMTAMLAEIAGLGVETVLMLDDAERLPVSSSHLLAYLMQNAPPNLHLVVGSRVPLAVATAELTAKGNLALLQTADLRLRQEESVEILLRRFGARISLDDCVRLHEATEGWPIGLQLAAASIERSEDPGVATATLSGRHGDIGEYFMGTLFSRLSEPLATFLVQTSILERLSVDLCEAVTCCGHSAEYLDQLANETPFLAAAEQQHWMRLHPLARDFLLARFEQLPTETREIFHCRAYHYFARSERFHEAACHALAAGDLSATEAHAARSLWTLGTQGRITEARTWLERIPQHVLDQDIELGLIAAWIIASSERNGEALATAQSALHDPDSTPNRRLVAARVAGVAAIYSDRLGLVQDILADWPVVEDADPLYVVAHENGRSVLALYAGANSEVRERGARAPSEHSSPSLPFALAFSRTLVALSHLQDGNCYRVESMLRPLLAEAERTGGRRGTAACFFAGVQAAALRELGQPSAALAVLADRLDAIERCGVPEVVLLAYRTLANVALDQNDERRALHVLQNLEAFAARRELPRLALHALSDAVRIHAQRNRVDTAAQLLARLGALVARFDEHDLLPLRPHARLLQAMASAQLALARADEEGVLRELEAAEALAAHIGRMGEMLTVRALRAVLFAARGDQAATRLLAEAAALAEIGGLQRALLDAHPEVSRLLGAMSRQGNHAASNFVAIDRAAPKVVPAHAGALLTPKEAHILALLATGLSNKLIARAMEISDETVKWHLKNLFAKLSAGSRKHAVGRARLLGLLPD